MKGSPYRGVCIDEGIITLFGQRRISPPMSNQGVSRSSWTGRWIAIAACLALLVALILQWRAISQLRHEIELLRAQAQTAPPDVASQLTVSAGGAVDMQQLQKDSL